MICHMTQPDLPDLPDPTVGPIRDCTSSGRGSRRQWLLGSLGGAALLAGAGLAWWRQRAPGIVPVASAPTETVAGVDFWSLSLATPEGGTLALQALRGRPLLLNFWATWCPPCVEELPLLDRFYRENSAKSWQVLGIAVDQRDAVQRFLARSPVAFPVVLAGFPGMELSKSLGNLSGALPFTVVLGQDGVVAHRKMGKVVDTDLSAWQRLI